ncbi:[protein release factor]-glutamine N5-methyltransferase [Paraperlucidibaca baekdonensis]|uniref:Release factor glutamine methyltransferase n=1 Tax=Paraperlucidibaca baekdonensis TaxID=748120 RepID=A0A3E0H5G9_9GAMM|nr:peptide chain release factor N(5)-glutamine methyltransferase [Paraperlucidibaca baekdonensis]REH38700.1 [protein release factor]-glutamine N5-methyltransferase [Paraperlucidibaca baekdonensis]
MPSQMTVNHWLAHAAAHLAQYQAWQPVSGEAVNARREARAVLLAALEQAPAWLMTWPDAPLNAEQQARADDFLARRAQGEPMAYLRGEQEFWSLALRVVPGVLVPRADSECLVEQALLHLAANTTARVLDLGTGSGAIALAIAHERREARVFACDRSALAVTIAQGNAARLGLALSCCESDWLSAFAGERFEMIVSNPPYIAEDDPHLASLHGEPLTALTATEQGLADLRQIITSAPAHLSAHGYLLLEHGYDQAAAVRDLLQQAGFVDVASRRDFGGNERVSLGRWPGASHGD